VHEVKHNFIRVHACHTVREGCHFDEVSASAARAALLITSKRRLAGQEARRSKSQEARGGHDETTDMNAHDMDMGDVCGEPGKTDGKDGNAKNGYGDRGKDGGGCKTGHRNPPRNGKNDGGKNGRRKDDKGKNGCVDSSDSDSDNELDSAGYDGPCLPNRPKRKFLPSQTQAMTLLSMAVVPPEDRDAFEDRFRSSRLVKQNLRVPRLELCAGQVLIGLRVHMAAILPFNCIPQRPCSHHLE
jgi:hypothetical protein